MFFPSISFWSPTLASGAFGCAISWIFLVLNNYIVDAYLFSDNALAANTAVRSCCAAGFPLFATQMYETFDPRRASTLLDFITLVMSIPLVLYKFGPTLRARSKFVPKQPPMQEKLAKLEYSV